MTGKQTRGIQGRAFSSSGKQKHLGKQRGEKASGVSLLLSSASLGVMAPKENPEGLREGMEALWRLGRSLLLSFAFLCRVFCC